MTQYDITLEHEGAHAVDPSTVDADLAAKVAGKLRSDKLKRQDGAELTIVQSVNTSGVSTVYTVEVATVSSAPPVRPARKAVEPKPEARVEPAPVVTTDEVVEKV